MCARKRLTKVFDPLLHVAARNPLFLCLLKQALKVFRILVTRLIGLITFSFSALQHAAGCVLPLLHVAELQPAVVAVE